MRAADKQEKLARADWRVYVILDPQGLADRPAKVPAQHKRLLEVAEQVLRGGAGVVQLRDKSATGAELMELGHTLKELCDEHDALFIINDRVDIATSCEADGIHLGPRDISLEDARCIAPELIIGGSAGTLERAKILQREGANYLGVGAIYKAWASKRDASNPRGPEVLAELSAQVQLPMVGIGGISAQHAADVIENGASGVAVIRAVLGAADPEAATRELLAIVDEALAAR